MAAHKLRNLKTRQSCASAPVKESRTQEGDTAVLCFPSYRASQGFPETRLFPNHV